jgi:hypothetical protein
MNLARHLRRSKFLSIRIQMDTVFVYKCIFLIAVVISVSYIGLMLKTPEGFTSSVRKVYRPYLRKARIATEGFRDKYALKMSNMMKRAGIVF